MKLIRWLLGKIILFLDRSFPPKALTPTLQRTANQQALLDQATRNLALYQFESCPFCVKVRRQIRRYGLKIELRDAKDAVAAQELLTGGGQLQVPCLRIQGPGGGEVRWIYESDTINRYLEDRFANPIDTL
jgi:glutaredoxin